MLRLGTLLIRRLAPAVVCALAVVACGSNQKPSSSTTTNAATGPSPKGKTVYIYSSLPESGADAARSRQIETGIRFAMGQTDDTRLGFTVKYKALCDSPRSSPHGSHAPTGRGEIGTDTHTARRRCAGSWSQASVVKNAHIAASNPQTVAYIGDLNSGATAVSLPILNQAGIVQITPGSAYPGLTESVPVKPKQAAVTQASEPARYYPRGLGHRTLLRMIPSDLVQASAALYVLEKAGCQKFSAWNFDPDPDPESGSLLAAVIATAPKYRMVYVPAPPLPKQAARYESYLQALGHLGTRCAIMVGHVTRAAEQVTLDLHLELGPTVPIVGTSGFCTAAWLQGISSVDRKAVAPELSCTTPGLRVTAKDYPGSAGFIEAFRQAYKRRPTAYDLYGYAAAKMLLRALADTGREDDPRTEVLINMVQGYAPSELAETPGQIRAFSFTSHGNLETPNGRGINSYGVDQFEHGKPGNVETVRIDTAHLLLPDG